jgi:translation initiation factor IF-2
MPGDKGKTNIAGCTLESGRFEFEEGTLVKVIRKGSLIGEFPMRSLKKFRNDVEIVSEGDCGVALTGFEDFEAGDILECVGMKALPKTSEWLHSHVSQAHLAGLAARTVTSDA